MNSRSCKHAIQQVYYYLDGETSWIKRARIERHLRKCRQCSSAYSFESHLKSIVRERTQEPASPEIIERFRSFLKENESGFGS